MRTYQLVDTSIVGKMFDPSEWDSWRGHPNITKLSGDRFIIQTKSKSIYLSKGDVVVTRGGDVFLAEQGMLDLAEPSPVQSKE